MLWSCEENIYNNLPKSIERINLGRDFFLKNFNNMQQKKTSFHCEYQIKRDLTGPKLV